ncbi:hypothetical protein [Moraxella lacunata]
MNINILPFPIIKHICKIVFQIIGIILIKYQKIIKETTKSKCI